MCHTNTGQPLNPGSFTYLWVQQLGNMPVLLDLLPYRPVQLGRVQLERGKGSSCKCQLLAMLALAEVQGAALQEVGA